LKTAQGYEPDAFDYDLWTTVPGAARLPEQFGYGYDAAGNLAARTNHALVQTFGVNNLNELSSATNNGTLTVAGNASEFSAGAPFYRSSHGVTNVTVSGTGLSSGLADLYFDGSWARSNATPANGANSYTAIAEDDYGRLATNSVNVNLPATSGYSYDLNGNLLADGARSFAYDDENELVSVWQTNGWREDYVYDGLMRRRMTRQYAWNGSSWVQTNEVRYVYDGNLVIQERDGNNVPQVTYTRGNDLSASLQGAGGIGGLLARTDNGLMIGGSVFATAYYFSDQNGNVAGMVYTNGTLAAKYNYDPYGNLLAMSGPLADANVYRYSSKEWNATAGLYYYLYRFYDPNLQRWLNRDPLGEAGGINLYAYVKNNPINYFDPLGLALAETWGAGGVAAGAGITLAGSVVVDAYTGGVNIAATPAEVAVGGVIGGGIGYAAGWWADLLLGNRNINKPKPFPTRCESRGAGSDVPTTGAPGSSTASDNGNGTGTIRDYGPDGKAETDYDFGHDHTGAGDPHAHDWDWTGPKPVRQPARPLNPGE
jgi:RHS repeat-associated protein